MIKKLKLVKEIILNLLTEEEPKLFELEINKLIITKI